MAAQPALQRLGELRPAAGVWKTAGIYDPESITLKEIVTPPAPADLPVLSVDEIAKLTGNAARGKETVTRCLMCHTVNGTGAELGPALDGWGRGKSATVVATAIVTPSSEIAFGYEGHRTEDQGRPDDPGRAHQAGRPADDA